jgi:hypothetical protein
VNQHCNGIGMAKVVITLSIRENIEVMIVVARDGKVPHPPVAVGRCRSPDHHRRLPVRSLELRTLFELTCCNELVQIRSVDWTNGFWVINLRTLRDGGDYGQVP